MAHGDRYDRHDHVSAELSLRSDRQLSALLDHSPALGTGIGGTSALLDVRGVPVFAKRIRLTDLERRPANIMSTANLFGLPPYCQYGVGSPGFTAWRELAATIMTTNWVLAGRTEAFPLLHHWRVLPGVGPLSEETADIDGAVAYWGGSQAMRERLHALAHASAGIVLFLEFIPHNVTDWLGTRATADEGTTAAVGARIESQLLATVEFMNANGLTHFDAHFGNVLTDGDQLYVTDFGLATSPRFDLSAPERLFLRDHRTHDAGYAAMRLVNWLVTAAEPDGAPASVAAQIRRYAPVAAIMNEFYRQLFAVSRATPYPAEEVTRALAGVPSVGLEPTL